MPPASPGNLKSQQPLLWIVLAAVILVCAVLFRGPAPTPGTGRGSAASHNLAEGISELRDAAAQLVPPELTSAVQHPGVALRNAAIYLALEKTVDLDYKELPLEEAIADVARQLDIPVWFDRSTLSDEGVLMDQPVSIRVRGISGRSALALIMDPVPLNWVIEDEVLKVTTSAKAGESLEVKVYDVTDLVVDRDPKAPSQFYYYHLINVIEACVQSRSWENGSGPGSISGVTLPDQARTLAIRQTQSIHEEVRKLLADLRKARRTEGDIGERSIVVSADESAAAGRERWIRRALNQPVQLRVRGPMEEVVLEIARQAGFQAVIDTATLKDEGVPTDAPVALDGSENTARSALRLILQPLQLAYLIRDEVLVVTTSAKAGEFVEPRVYDMTDIAPKYRTEEGHVVSDMTTISRAIPGTIQPDSWADGPPVILPFRTAGIFVLVFPQTQAIHEEVEDFLEQLQKLQRTRAVSTKPNIPAALPALGPAYRGMRLLLDTRRDAIVHGNNRFALELYGKLAGRTTGNLLVSPYAVSSAVAQVYAGARGHTAREIDWTMHFNLRQEDVPAGFRTLRVASFLPGPDSKVTPINRLWTQSGIEILEPFRKSLVSDYGTPIASIDFSDRDAAARAINDWAVSQDEGSILRVANPGDFPGTDRVVLTNVVQFHGKWSQLFDRENTKLEKFASATGEVEVAMMHLESDRARYAVVDGAQVLDKPFGNGDLSLVVLLPAGSPTGLADLERSFHESSLSKWLTADDSKSVEVWLPRFQLESAFHLGRELETLGMRSAFDLAKADLSGICEEQKLALGEVIHKASVEVDEQGPRAAPGMAERQSPPAGIPDKQAVFRADRPFLFLIRDNRTGAILFIGRVVDPGARQGTAEARTRTEMPAVASNS